jgi:hypothetical protein
MIDVEKNRKQLLRLEAHVAWIKQNIGDGPALQRRIAEISRTRAKIATATATKCQLVKQAE